ncbi:LacI family DNA-binding transcriptional regulator [Tropicibacter oceani]|uniref:Substrate-binding domain-containing protein n=1 Tax=Tropicibacter oceani TaxID=3058420 RepID=A0ABY8QLY1_9RHOB|nr:substrate-binding domain-containing protein [Tropicibacter oceani]WGW05651.1 substrate-binding domain-containing protein [Tropicibacter oceani]
MQDSAIAQPRPTSGKRVTISDLARHLDLTKGTVSRALNGYSDISEATCLRVRKAADKLGYRPLSQAQAIRTGRSRSIGLVLEVTEHDAHRPFVAEFLAGLSEAASREDWTMTVATAASDDDTLRLMQKLADERKADGFILPRTKLRDPRVAYLRSHGIPFILYGRTEDPTGCAWFDIASEDAMAEAVQRLAALGHRRIGFVPGATGYTYSKLRLEGYRAGLAAAGLDFDPGLVADPAVGAAAGEAAAHGLVSLDRPATAILYSVDRAALGAYEAARQRGLHIGRDLSIMSYDGIPEGDLIEPKLTTWAVDTRKAGARLAEMLIHLIRGAAVEDCRELVPASFQERGSHGALPE